MAVSEFLDGKINVVVYQFLEGKGNIGVHECSAG